MAWDLRGSNVNNIYAINPVCTEDDDNDDDVDDDKINGLYKFTAAKNSQCERYARTHTRACSLKFSERKS